MTESEWLNVTDPEAMLEFLRGSGRASERKLCLFAYGSVRRVWHLLTDERSRRALEAAEAHADGLAGVRELREAVLAADKAAHRANRTANQARAARRAAGVAQLAFEREAAKTRTPPDERGVERAEQVVRRAVRKAEQLAALAEATRGGREAAWAAVLCVRAAWYRSRGLPGQEFSLQQAVEAAAVAAGDSDHEARIRCDLLRDLFGPLPFRSVVIDPSWLRWNDGTIQRMAQGIYSEGAFHRMPILADALLDAGCDSEDILSHCRGPGPHVRGCWVVDLLLSRE